MLYNIQGKRTNHKPVLQWDFAAREISSKYDTSVLFSRKSDVDEKIAAVKLILDLFTPDRWPDNLRMLTMPGVHWRFELGLLRRREGNKWIRKEMPDITYITGAENNRSIFSASLCYIPGIRKTILKETNPTPFAEIGFKTNFASHLFCNVDDLLCEDHWRVGAWNAAWLDYTGPLSIARLDIIRRFYNKHLKRGILIVTALRARWNRATVDAIDNAGGHSEWLREHLEGNVLHDVEYMDTSPMAQFAVGRL